MTSTPQYGTPRTKIRTVTDIINLTFPPNTDFWGKRLLYPGCTTLLTGAAGSAKSMLALNLAGALCSNVEFMGMATRGKHIVGYLNTEIDDELMQERLEMLSQKYDYSGFYEMRAIGPDYDFFASPEDIQHVKEIVKRKKTTVLIIDCLYSLHTGDENAEGDMKKVTRALKEIIEETNVACLLVHHTGRQSFNPRGSSVLDGWVNNVINITNNKKTNSRTLHFNKVRGTQEPDSIILDLCCDSLQLCPREQETAKDKAKRIRFLKKMMDLRMNEATVTELTEMLGIKENSVIRKINMYKESGLYTIELGHLGTPVSVRMCPELTSQQGLSD